MPFAYGPNGGITLLEGEPGQRQRAPLDGGGRLPRRVLESQPGQVGRRDQRSARPGRGDGAVQRRGDGGIRFDGRQCQVPGRPLLVVAEGLGQGGVDGAYGGRR